MKRTFATVLAGTMAVTLLAGCGSSGGSTSSSGTQSSGTQTSGTQTSSGSAAASSGNVTLKVFDAMAYATDEYQTVIDQFETDHPGVTVEIQHAANDSNTILQSRFNSGDIPDVFLNEPGSSAQLYYEYAYDWAKDTDTLSKFNSDAVALGTDESGHVYGLPWTYETMALTYNVDCFNKAGITTLPVTMEELEQDCEKLKAAGIQPFAIAGKETWVLAQMSTHFIMDKSLDATGTVEGLESGKITFADLPHWQSFFKLLDLIKKYDSDKILETGWESSENELANGEAAIIHMGDWAQANYTKMNPDAKLAFLPVPVGDSADDATVLSSVGWLYMVYKDSPNLDLAKEFCEYVLTSEQGVKWMTEGVDAVPASNTHTEMSPSGDLPKDSQTYIQAGKTNGWIHTIAGSSFSDTVGPYIQGYLLGNYTADDVTQAFQEYFSSQG